MCIMAGSEAHVKAMSGENQTPKQECITEAASISKEQWDRVNKDILKHGKGFMQEGKHIPFENITIYTELQDTEREEAIDGMLSYCSESGFESPSQVCEALYDNGYRKVKELSDEEIYYKFARTCPSIDEDYITGARWARDYILGKDK